MYTIIITAAGVGVGWIGISYAMEPLFPMGDLRWLILAAIGFTAAGVAVFWERRRKMQEKQDSHLGPEIRISDTMTYRQQPDGSRIVTQTTLAKPVRIGSALGSSGVGGATTLKPPADDGEKD